MKGKLEEARTKVRSLLDGGNATAATGLGINTYGGGSTDLEAKPLMQRGEDGEYEDTRGKDNRQILTQQKKMIKN